MISGGLRRCCKRPNSNPRSRRRIDPLESGYTVDLEDLLFTPFRHFLIRNNGKRVWVDDLKGKTIVLFIVPIKMDPINMDDGDILDMIQAYHELSPFGNIEFVCVPVYCKEVDKHYYSACFDHLFSSIPFPAVPFSDIGDRVVHTFSATTGNCPAFSYWVIIDPTSTVVATRAQYCFLFKHFGGAELYPLSRSRIRQLLYEFDRGHGRESRYRDAYDLDDRLASRKRLIRKWDHLLASPSRDFLLSNNGGRVPISSLKGKVIGLYFCENIPNPPRMERIKEAYRDAKLRGYDFEIVQINYHFGILNQRTEIFSDQQRYKNIDWLALPFKDPSCRKLHRIFKCKYDLDDYESEGDCLVIIDDSRRDRDQVLFDFCGAEFITHYGIEGYPFTRHSLYESEYARQKREVKLQPLFPPGLCQFNDSQLKGKRLLVLFSCYLDNKHGFPFVSMLKAKYSERAEDANFEVVYVSLDDCESQYIQDIQDMPWLVHPYSPQLTKWCAFQIFRSDRTNGFAAFDIDGQLISKGIFDSSLYQFGHQFPFFPGDLRGLIKKEVDYTVGEDRYYYYYTE